MIEATKKLPENIDSVFLQKLKAILTYAETNKKKELFIRKTNLLLDYTSLGNVETAYVETQLQRAETYLKSLDNTSLAGKFYLRKGYYYYFSDADYKQSEIDLKKSFAYFSTLNDSTDKDFGIASRYLSQLMINKGDFLQSLRYSNVSVALFKIQKDTLNYLWSRMELEILLSNNLIIQEADDLRQETRRIAEEKKIYGILANSYATEAAVAKKLGQFEKRINLLEKSYSYTLKTPGQNGRAMEFILRCLLTIEYSRVGNLGAAANYMQLIDAQLPDFKSSERMFSFSNVARAYYLFAIKKYEQSKKLNEKNLRYFNKNDDREGQLFVVGLMVSLHEALNQQISAYKSFKTLTALKDSTFAVAKTNQLIFYRTQYEAVQKDKEISRQKHTLHNLAIDHRNRLSLIVLLIFTALVITGALYLIQRRRQAEAKQKRQVQFSRQLIQSQETERKRISKDLHDGIGQKLVLLQNKTTTPDTKTLISDTLNEVRGFSRNLHPFVLEKFGLMMALKQLIDSIDQNSEIFVVQEIADLEIDFSEEVQLNVYRMVQECLTNVLKHSGSESVRIECYQIENWLIIQIIDFGKGFNPKETLDALDSFGMKTLAERSNLINATLTVKSTVGKGSTITIKVPHL